MSHYPFLIDMSSSLLEECGGGFIGFSRVKSTHGRPIDIFLWKNDSSGIKVRCEMHDLEPRLEVGSLVFTKVKGNYKNLPVEKLPEYFNSKLKVEKLLYVDETSIVESGVVITAHTGEELLIVSGAFPYTVEICIAGVSQDFDPEYPIPDYKRQPI